ncbi:glycosyltransferase family 4 protein [Hahella sp. HN01]|uniref:glycosyltransferase family 4 protein n=1 Tax=Hahella sp. HN01 TaxID=2847262 RepID=UPI001C1EA6CD|nr:glycosyltransferase family 4 protein [Hahella sp. HN01]MBU6950609.1 glycosyltransferase family 4 protein [Hahella sp. HN01]
MSKILILYHCESNTGYAIGSLERIFWRMGLNLVNSPNNIHLCYPSFTKGIPTYPPGGYNNYLEFSDKEADAVRIAEFAKYIKDNDISILFGFDQPLSLPYYKAARAAGIKAFISYWGAPMSSLNSGVKLILKKLDASRYRQGPDLYIFESIAMQKSGYLGRGISKRKTAVCYLGVDVGKYRPDSNDRFYAHDLYNLPRDNKLFFYSGHFEERKGVRVIAEAANIIVEQRSDVTFLLFGNKDDEASPYEAVLTEKAKKQVIFGGYRDDLERIHRSCFAGIIASVGWDSFTMSSIEMQASGLPLIVSDLQGLSETIIDGKSGFLFQPGSSEQLSLKIQGLLSSNSQRDTMSSYARERIVEAFSDKAQVSKLTSLVNQFL